MNFRHTHVVVPAYNVSDQLEGVLSHVLEYVPAKQVVVVDDGSTDGTAEAAAGMRPCLVRHGRNLGKGEALKSGFRFCLGKGAERVFTLDGDGQHDPGRIPAFLEILERTKSDLVVGMRRFRVGDMPFDRIFSNRTSSFIVSLVAGFRIFDSQCGYRLYRRSVLETVRPVTHRYETETEMLILARRGGFAIGWCPVESRYGGEPSHIHRMHDTVRFLKLISRFV
jgi:glycosyltransferase involved in cell wall biosynthesis